MTPARAGGSPNRPGGLDTGVDRNRHLQTLAEVSSAEGATGQVGVIGGSIGFTGPPVLSALAALRTGTDDARVLVPEPLFQGVVGYTPNVLADRYGGERFDERAIDDARVLGDWSDVVVIGPGLNDADPDAVAAAIEGFDVPVVVDAEAVGPAMAVDTGLADTVFTPDSSEEEHIEDAYGSLEAFSRETGAVVVLTGDVDVLVADGETWTNETGTVALTVTGTGDTLAGIVASLIGQGMNRAEAADLGAWILGKAGEFASADRGAGVVATDVIDRIPDTVR